MIAWVITAALTGFAVGVMVVAYDRLGVLLEKAIYDRYIRQDFMENEAIKRLTGCEAIDIVFKDREDNPTLEFVDVEIDGHSVNIGEWHYGADWVYLRLGKGEA